MYLIDPFLHFQGYELIKDATCSRSDAIIRNWYYDKSDCKSRCDKMEYCRFFVVDTYGWCALYKSCDERRVVKNRGSTFRKIEGLSLLNSFLSLKFLSKFLVINIHSCDFSDDVVFVCFSFVRRLYNYDTGNDNHNPTNKYNKRYMNE